MKRSKLLTIPRAATRMLPAPTHLRRLFVALVALLSMTAQTAWADDVNITTEGQTFETATWSNCTVNIVGSSEVTFSGVITISGDVTLNLGEGTTLNANSGIRVNVRDKLTINGPGTLNAGHEGNQYAAIGSEKSKAYGEIVINGGTINLNTSTQRSAACIGGGYQNPYSKNSKITINGGSITASESKYFSIGSGHCGSMGHILIKGGQINVHKIGGDYWDNNNTNDDDDSSLTLDWTNETDFIQSDYNLDSKYTPNITMSIAEGKYFKYVDENNNDVGATINWGTSPNFGGKKIVPRHPSNLANATVSGIRGSYALHSAGVTLDYSVTAFLGESALTEGTDYTTALVKDGTSKPIDMQDGKYILTETGTYTLSITGTNTYHGTKTIAFSVVDPLELTAETTTLDATVSTAYRVNENLSIDNRLTVTGDVTLVLNAGQTLTLSQGVNVAEGQTLTIEGAGALISTGTGGNAAIGGNSGASHGNIIINGGMITATASDASGIGRGKNGGNSGSVVLGWTNATDFVDATYDSNNLSIAAGKQFIFADEIAFATTSNISGRKIVPFLGNNCLDYATVSISPFFPYSAQGTSISYTVTAHEGTDALVEGTDYTTEVKKGEDIINKTGDAYSLTSEGDYTLTITGTGDKFGSKTVGFSVVEYLPVTTTTETLEGSFNVPFKVTEDVTVSNRLVIHGEVTLILGAGTELKANKGIGVSDGNTLTIKGQGALTANGGDVGNAGIGGTKTPNVDNPSERAYGHIIIEGGTIVANGVDGGAGIGGAVRNYDYGNSIIEIKGGVVNATGGVNAAGIGAGHNNLNGDGPGGATGTIKILGGQVTANRHSNNSQDVQTAGIGRGFTVGNTRRKGSLVLGWTNETDFIETYWFGGFEEENISFVDDQRFVYDGTKSVASKNEIATRRDVKLLPADEHDIELGEHNGDLHMYYLYNDGSPVTIDPCTVTTFLGNKLKEGRDFEVKYRNNSNDVLDHVTDEGVYTRIIKGISPYYGQIDNAGTFNVSKPIIVYETQNPVFNDFIYIVDHDVTEDDRVKVSGNSTLILNAGKTYTALNGILVPAGASLTIKGEGKLIAGPSTNNDKAVRGRAGIGGGGDGFPDISYRSHGDIIIEGGHIIAKGSQYAAGIGGAVRSKDEGGKIIIRGGVVEATGGEKAAGIGGGYNYTENSTPDGDGITGNIIIEGGQVTAIAGENGGSAIGKAAEATGTGSKLTIAMTGPGDFLNAGSYGVDAIDFGGKSFILDKEGYPAATVTNMAGETVRPIAYLTSNLAHATVSGVEQTYTYTSSAQTVTPVVTAYNETAPLTEGTHYTTVLKKSNGDIVNPTEGVYKVTAVDTYTFTFTAVGDGGYNGEKAVSFDVTSKPVTNEDITVSIPSQEYTGSALTPEVSISDGSKALVENTDYTITLPDGRINTGDYTITLTGIGNYDGTVEKTFTITPKTVTVNNGGSDVPAATGDAAITQDQHGVTLTLITPAENVEPQTVSIPTAVEVDHVNIERSFTSGKASTVYLPFSIAAVNVTGGKFYTFTGVDETQTPWVVSYDEVTGNIEANTPYIFMPDGTNSGKMVVNNTGKISVSTASPQTTHDAGNKWEFIGTHKYIQWLSDNSRADEIGLVYGFAAKDLTVGTTNYEVGQFVKIGSGAFIKPMRAYLKRSATAGARTLSRGNAESLPETMIVVLRGANGETTSVIELKNGKMEELNSFDSWYSLDGSKLSGKPTKKGLYINNGKKVVIK